ncbi:E3 ubiquitin-protein ligase TRIM39-like [Gouania willdenowi]|uniref:E3 ubiquitin-protein ligase TRIM39-like n=1 Tax=Gouania willdenowi TaxID=441366 RepID=A0A8C5CZW4_GOUWI|nr:E3 ubiquitin-protein ligase TRIM39-like [Gouania willdenowi]XP_028315870.1 E3 ubiquitin-protein ligase TRIM39-like [Gouania willdenowi]
MALPAAFLSEDQFTCSICLEVFNKPVSTPCGHSFCQSCISSYWDRGGKGGNSCQCPICKKSFRKRPELHINRALQGITEQFKQVANASMWTDQSMGQVDNPNSNVHPNQSALSQAQRTGEMPDGIFAEMMTRFQGLSASGVPSATISYPSEPQSPSRVNVHLAFNSQSMDHGSPPPAYSTIRRHSVSSAEDPAFNLPLCPVHRRELAFFCRTDNICLCSICSNAAEHKEHNITPAKREWFIKKSQVGIADMELRDLIEERERKVEELQNSLKGIQAAAQRETEGAVCAFTKLISTVECCQAEVLEVIELSLRAAEGRTQNLLKDLQEEIAELKKRSDALNQLSHSEDYVLFLQMFPSLSSRPQTKTWSGVSVSSPMTSGVVHSTVTQMMDRLQEDIRKLPELCQRSTLDQSVPRPSTKVKRVQEYAADITLDPNTAHPRLIISGDGKQVHCGENHQLVTDTPERFDRVVCVLAHQGFSSGRHYWEVEVGDKTDWDLGIASQSINRKGKITVSPANGYWFLSLRDQMDYAFRTEPSTNLMVSIRPSRIGIYVDCDKGLVSFYNVEARLLLYTFTDSFTDVVHPFFSPCTNRSGRNQAPLIICPVAVTDQ